MISLTRRPRAILSLAGELLLIPLVLGVPASLAMSISSLVYCAVISWCVGAVSGGALLLGRERSTTAVFKAFGTGFFLKIAGLVAVAFEMKARGEAVTGPLAYTLAALFLQQVWTSRRFSLSSTAGKAQ